MIKKTRKKLANMAEKRTERAARRRLFEEFFYDMYQSRRRVYWMNFWRGIFFGFGTVLGGTVVVALLIWALSQLVGWLPVSGEYIQGVIDAIRQREV